METEIVMGTRFGSLMIALFATTFISSCTSTGVLTPSAPKSTLGGAVQKAAIVAPPSAKSKANEAGRKYAGDSQPQPGNKAAQLASSAAASAAPSGGCLNPARVGDPDIRRNASKLPMSTYCVRLVSFTEGGFPWKIYTIAAKAGRPGPLWAVPHDDEDAAFDTAVYALVKYGGRISTIEAGESRTFRGQDTNRNFGTTASVARGCRQQKAAAKRYTAEFLNGYRRGGLIIALHTNTNGYSGNGGSGSISINRKSSIMRPYKSLIAKGSLADEDNLLLIAGTSLVNQDRKLSNLVEHFTKREGVHVIAEHVSKSKNDCSLSNYVMLTQPGRYYNIETQDGNSRTQIGRASCRERV